MLPSVHCHLKASKTASLGFKPDLPFVYGEMWMHVKNKTMTPEQPLIKGDLFRNKWGYF